MKRYTLTINIITNTAVINDRIFEVDVIRISLDYYSEKQDKVLRTKVLYQAYLQLTSEYIDRKIHWWFHPTILVDKFWGIAYLGYFSP
ncbi:MAG: hypothetical protein ACFFD2_11460 [Promethearchaeota archaeon]